MMNESTRAEVYVGRQGRIVIPAHMRRELNIQPGERLIARIEDGRLVLEKREQIIARIQKEFDKIPPEVSLVDELIAERRAEAKKELKWMEESGY